MHYLTKEVFDEIFFKAKKGDIESKRKYLASIEGLIVKNIRRYYPDYKNFDDLLQDGNLYALTLLDRYDPAAKSPPLGFISNYIRYFYLDKNKKKKELTILDSTPKSGDEDTMSIKDSIRDDSLTPEETILTKDMAQRLLNSIDSLDPIYKEIIYRYYFERHSSEKIAHHLSISKRRFYYEKQKALAKLKEGVDHDLLACASHLEQFTRSDNR